MILRRTGGCIDSHADQPTNQKVAGEACGAAMEAAYSDPTDTCSGLDVRLPTILQTVGSSKYAPQEQFLGSPPSPRDDVYALGVFA